MEIPDEIKHPYKQFSGGDIIGLNCQYDPDTCIEAIKAMKDALDAEDLHPFLMLQPVGFHCPDARNLKGGYHDLPEFPFGEKFIFTT